MNEDPAVKIPQIRKAVDRGDQSVLPQLVSDLDSDDAAVRLYSIQALERLTGQTYGYDWTITDRAERRPAIDRWRGAHGLMPESDARRPAGPATRSSTAPTTTTPTSMPTR